MPRKPSVKTKVSKATIEALDGPLVPRSKAPASVEAYHAPQPVPGTRVQDLTREAQRLAPPAKARAGE